ncbi:hypothetical protein, partial [Segatella copri]
TCLLLLCYAIHTLLQVTRISPSVCILFPFDADEKSTTFASGSRKNAVLRELKSIEDIRI